MADDGAAASSVSSLEPTARDSYEAELAARSRALAPPFCAAGLLLRAAGAAHLASLPVLVALLATPWLRVLSAAPTATTWTGAAGARRKLQAGLLTPFAMTDCNGADSGPDPRRVFSYCWATADKNADVQLVADSSAPAAAKAAAAAAAAALVLALLASLALLALGARLCGPRLQPHVVADLYYLRFAARARALLLLNALAVGASACARTARE